MKEQALTNIQNSHRNKIAERKEATKAEGANLMTFDALAYINKDGAPLGKFNIELDKSQLRLISTG